jgi:hypothetical protein
MGEADEVASFRAKVAKGTVEVLGKCLDLLGMKRTEEI